MIVHQAYLRETINVTGRTYGLCSFHECTLIDEGPPVSEPRSRSDAGGNAFRFCEFVGQGWPDAIKRSKVWRPR